MKSIIKQHGIALLIFILVMATAAASVTVKALNNASQNYQIAREKITSAALAQAKDALIGYASSVDLSSSSRRPGDLPCPDTNNDGITETSCGNASGSTGQSLRIGRLPWKTLGLPDLRDGSGERLWYAVSNNFKYNTRTSCSSAGQPGCLNSDTVGTISIFAANGTILSDGGGNTGAVAVIIAPGNILTRSDKSSPQDRSNTGINDPQNYLDIALGKDNANFADSSSTNGFIQGIIKDSNGKTILNDQLLIITQEEIMKPIQKRVAGEVKNCLNDYALHNNNRYPWAAPITDLSSIYNDNTDTYFGRIPDYLGNTQNDSDYHMSVHWGSCNTDTNNTPSRWWLNWKEMVFYGVAKNFKPRDSSAPGFPSTCASAGNCLNINRSNIPARFVVIVAGKTLNNPNQTNRNSNKSSAFYYLEGGNQNVDQSGGYTFTQMSPSTTFNDTLEFQ